MSRHHALLSLAYLGLMSLASLHAQASPAVTRVLGVSHRVISAGPPLTIELTLRPTRDFDSVTVEGGGGVKTLSGDCHFTGVAAGTPYVCRLELAGTTADAFMSVNIVGTSQPADGGLAQSDVQHLTFRNGAFQKAKPTPSVHQLPRKNPAQQ